MRWLLNIPLMLLWNLSYAVVRLLMLLRFVSLPLLLLVLVIVPLLLFVLPRLDRNGSYLMVVGVVIVAFVAGKLTRKG